MKIEYIKSENDEAYKIYIETMEEKLLKHIVESSRIPEKYLKAETQSKPWN